MTRISLDAPAKINLTLRIGDVYDNGLHQIDSEMLKLDLCDRVEVALSTGRTGIDFLLENPHGFDVPATAENLCVRAARLFLESVEKSPGIRIQLRKAIPSCAGLGGGSSDAAAVLLAMDRLFPDHENDLDALASTLGSDVAFFLHNTPRARVGGTGERIEPLAASESFFFLVLVPRTVKISTAAAYQLLDEERKKGYAPQTPNHFEPLMCRQINLIDSGLRIIKNAAPFRAGLSGSGSAVFGLFEQPIPKEVLENVASGSFLFFSGKTLST